MCCRMDLRISDLTVVFVQAQTLEMSLMDARIQCRTTESRLRRAMVTNPGAFDDTYIIGKELGKPCSCSC